VKTGERIRYLREQLDVSQTTFGKAIGQNRLVVARWEAGTQEPKPLQLMRLAEILEISPQWMMKGLGTPPVVTPTMQDALRKAESLASTGFGVTSYMEKGSSKAGKRARSTSASEQTASPACFDDFLHALGQRVASLMQARSDWPTIPGIPPEVMSAFARQRALPSMRIIVPFAEAFGVPEEWLLTGRIPEGASRAEQLAIPEEAPFTPAPSD